ncbi:hypothetical protein [Nonomuraea salmonea]
MAPIWSSENITAVWFVCVAFVLGSGDCSSSPSWTATPHGAPEAAMSK